MTTAVKTINSVQYVSFDHQIAISGGLEEPQQFIEEFSVIRNAGENDVVSLFLNTPGGCLYTGTQFRSVLQKCAARTVAYLESGCHSAGTIIALSCDDLEVSDDSFMLIHNYSSGLWGKGTDLVKGVLEQDKWIKSIMREAYKDFLTEKEIEKKLFKSEDIYLQAAEIRERWERVLEARKLKADEETERLRQKVKDQLNSL